MLFAKNEEEQVKIIQNYYRFHAKIFDWTRFWVLLGRNQLVSILKYNSFNINILEIGCGTGRNLILLQKQFPNAKIIGLDISPDMLQVARKKVTNYPNISLLESSFPFENETKFDLIFCSYSLSMASPNIEIWIKSIKNMLSQNGQLAVVDFDYCRHQYLRENFERDHVSIDGTLFHLLNQHFDSQLFITKKAYFGLWKYSLFIGK